LIERCGRARVRVRRAVRGQRLPVDIAAVTNGNDIDLAVAV